MLWEPVDSSYAAVRRAVRMHQEAHKEILPPDTVITVVVGGVSCMSWNHKESNAQQPTYRHRLCDVLAKPGR